MRKVFRALLLVAAAIVVATSFATPILGVAAGSASMLDGDESEPPDDSRKPHRTDRIGVRLVDIPADNEDDPRARQYIVDELMPGTTIHRRIEVVNYTDSRQLVHVYSGAADIINGAFVGAAGRSGNDLSRWTSLNTGSVEIPPHSSVYEKVTVAVPEDAAPGEQYAVVWAEVRGAGENNIVLVNRVGIRMYFAVQGNNPAPSAFTVDTMTAHRRPDGVAVVHAQVHNTGGRALDMSGTLTLSKVSGSVSVGPYLANLGTTLAPGRSETVTFTVADKIGDGPWKATVELRSGLVTGKYQAEITFPREYGIGDAVAATEADDDTFLYLALAATALLSTVTFFLVRTHRRRSRAHINAD